MFCVCHAFLSVHTSLFTCLLALLCVLFLCVFVTFLYGVLFLLTLKNIFQNSIFMNIVKILILIRFHNVCNGYKHTINVVASKERVMMRL